jgi:hypothetical protein
MSDLRQFIERVLAKRQAQKPKFEAVEQDLRDLGRHLEQLRQLATATSASDDAPPELRQRAASLATGIDALESQVSDGIARTANLLARFSKNTINIGVAGKARQGKSTILQAISGLDNRVIPTSDGLPCTGAKSRILHRTNDPHAEIEYYKAEEFLREIVHAYYEELGLPNLPPTLDEFERSLPPKPNFEKPEEHAVYEKLKDLHARIGAYRPYLSRPPQRIGLDEVRDYVSQEDGRKRYLAVRCANIHVPFPNGDVTGLAIVDLPGLGEIAKGHSEKLVTSLQREVDAIVLVKLPADSGDDWFAADIKVFNEVKKAVPELDLADWLFVVLNVKDDGRNARQVEILKTRPLHIGSSPRLLAVNCLQSEAVRQGVFMEVLRHLEENLERIDLRQSSVLANHLSNLANESAALVQPLWDYFQKDTAGTGDFQKFGELFRSFRKQLRTNLDELTDEYRQQVRNKGMAREFGAMVDEACNAAKTSVPVPSPEDLKGRFFDLGGWKAVVQEELHHLRSSLTHCLADILDRRLGQMVEEVRRLIMARLMADPLGRVLPQAVRTEADPHRQLEALRRLLDKDAQPTLLAGVDYLQSFSFSYQSHFHHRVRETMDALDPMAVREQGEDDPIIAIAPPEASARYAEEVGRGLRSFYERVVWNVRKRLHQEMENDPMRAIFSMVEETRDRLVRAREVERQWERLLYPRRAEIWPDEFNRFAVASAQRQEWQNAIEALNRRASRLRSALA